MNLCYLLKAALFTCESTEGHSKTEVSNKICFRFQRMILLAKVYEWSKGYGPYEWAERHIAVAEWSERPTCFRLVGSSGGSNPTRAAAL